MEVFRRYLQQEFMRRTEKNSSYSLRAFARQLGVNHATLSTLLSGKRKLTSKAVLKIGKALSMSPEELNNLTQNAGTKKSSSPYFLLQNDAFSFLSDWHFDAILELTLIPNINLSPKTISHALGIPAIRAKLALELLERMDLLLKNENGCYQIQHQNSTNILDPDSTSAAQKKLQQVILQKSMETIEAVDRKDRDHSSMTMAINHADVPEVKKLIKKFRQNLNGFLQRDTSKLNSVYQLQVSFFPLTKISKNKE